MIKDKYRVLLVDDDPLDIELAMRAFGLCGVADQVLSLRDGRQVIDCLQGWADQEETDSCCPRLIILDLKMTSMDGFQLLEQIRQVAFLRHVPVLLFSSSRLPADITRGYELGCNAYVVKPVDNKEYNAALRGITDFWLKHNLVRGD